MSYKEFKNFFDDTLKYLIFVLILFLMVIYLMGFSQISGNSMNPNFEDEDLLFISKLHYNFFDVNRMDVIAINLDGETLIKRVIGLPDEKIKYDDGNLYVNGEIISDEFARITDDFSLYNIDGKFSVIPENMYLVLGDNRSNSLDSREYGLISKNDIIGKCVLTIWPLNNFGAID